MDITGAQLFVKALKAEKVDTLFAYPGGQVIDLFDVLYDEQDINIIMPRHEQGLIHAADGYARSTGRVGVCLVTSGPGATNLVTGIATAQYDSVPLVCFTGQVASGLMGSSAFQEVDIVSIVKSITKYAVTVKRREDLADIIQKAFHIAKSGKPGVVLVDLPKDIQRAYGSREYQPLDNISCDIPKEKADKALDILNKAQRPLFLVGGGVNIAGAGRALTSLAELTGIPVVTTIMGRGAIPTWHKLYIGNLGIHGSYAANMAVNSCDVLFAIGTRFSDRITGDIKAFAPSASVIYIDIDNSGISGKITPVLNIKADALSAVNYLLKKAKPLQISAWQKQLDVWKSEKPIVMKGEGLTPKKIIDKINAVFKNGIIVTDVGQNQMWTTQFIELDGDKKLLTSGGMGTMGYGLPAGIGAKIGNPDRDVVVISGDGGIQMNIQEIATATANELPVIVCIMNNSSLGNVRQWQKMFYNKRYSCVCMRYRKSCGKNCTKTDCACPDYIPDFVKLAEGFGAVGVRVTNENDIENALIMARSNKKCPTIIEFLIDKEQDIMPIVPPGNAISDMIL